MPPSSAITETLQVLSSWRIQAALVRVALDSLAIKLKKFSIKSSQLSTVHTFVCATTVRTMRDSLCREFKNFKLLTTVTKELLAYIVTFYNILKKIPYKAEQYIHIHIEIILKRKAICRLHRKLSKKRKNTLRMAGVTSSTQVTSLVRLSLEPVYDNDMSPFLLHIMGLL
jgi:hypothetical protein